MQNFIESVPKENYTIESRVGICGNTASYLLYTKDTKETPIKVVFLDTDKSVLDNLKEMYILAYAGRMAHLLSDLMKNLKEKEAALPPSILQEAESILACLGDPQYQPKGEES